MKRYVLVLMLAACLGLSSASAQTRAKAYPDAFAVLNELNKASTVMVVEQGIVPKSLGVKIAQGLLQVIADGEKPGGKRPGDSLYNIGTNAAHMANRRIPFAKAAAF